RKVKGKNCTRGEREQVDCKEKPVALNMGCRNNYGIAIAVALLLLCWECTGLSLTVFEEECMYEKVEYEGDAVSGNFVVVDHDAFWRSESPAMDFTVTAPGGNVVYNLKASTGDKFQFRAPRSGVYKFCFHNSYAAPETVSFYIHVGHIPSEHDLAKDEHLDPINVRIAQLREALESASAEQKYLKSRDTRHRR
ncbi:hypothetical protein KI387_005756, partial [Taxus chinensis]